VPVPKSLWPTQTDFLFDIHPEPAQEKLTALAGVPLFVRAFRSLGGPQSVQQHLHLKQRERGFNEAALVESLLILNAVGGDCLEDLDRLRQDPGWAELIGHEVPSAVVGRKFLYRFHEEERIEQARQQLRLGEVSYIPEESAPLRGLAAVNRDLVRELGRRCATEKIATIDLDSTVIESWKQEAQPTYQGGAGYQPLVALWAEMDVVLAEEFRDGNVPAQRQPLRVARQAFAAVPPTVREFYFRGDSACYDQELIEWLRDEQREGGPPGFIGFAISVRMNNPTLRGKILRLPEEAWKPYGEEAEVIKECAEVNTYWPEARKPKEYGPLRWVAIRVRQRQGELFAEGVEVKHYAVVTNLWAWSTQRLLEWHREKAGSIEAVHDVLKNELAAGVLPCGRFGANAAWFRLAVMTHNVLTALKRLALPPELLAARPKRLRFLIFHTPGRLVRHARRMILKLACVGERIAEWLEVMRLLPLPA